MKKFKKENKKGKKRLAKVAQQYVKKIKHHE